MQRAFAIVLGFSLFAVAAPAQAEWGLKMPSLNPFKKKDEAAKPASQPAGWHWLGSGKKPDVVETKPSMLSRMSAGTKSAWTKTKDTVYPWGAKAKEPAPLPVTGSHTIFSKGAKKPEKKPFWAWGNDEDEQRPQKASSVSDFIGGQRPE